VSLAVRQETFPIGFGRLAMLLEELGGTPVSLGRLIVNGGGMLMWRGMPALPLLVLAAIGFRALSLAVRQAKFPIGFARLAMLLEEFGGTPVSLGRPVMSGGRTLMCCDIPFLMLLVLAVRFTHKANALT
jgi:hypothetical protein